MKEPLKVIKATGFGGSYFELIQDADAHVYLRVHSDRYMDEDHGPLTDKQIEAFDTLSDLVD